MGRLLKSISEKLSLFQRRLFSKQVSGLGLALFRISFFSIILIEILQLLVFRDVVFDSPGIQTVLLLVIWMLAVVCIVVGIFTKYAALVNFAFMVGILAKFTDFEYHIDYIYSGISFLCLIVPLENRISLSTYFEKSPPRKTPVVYYYLIVVVGLASIYAESCFHKLDSKMWMSGLGVWLPNSLPQVAPVDWSLILNFKPLSITLGYFALAFESLFILLMWFRRIRPWVFWGGIGLHLGILATFKIPLFALAMLVFYFLVMPDEWARRICREEKGTPSDYKRVTALKFMAMSCLVIVMQLLAIVGSPNVARRFDQVGLSSIASFAGGTEKVRSVLFGMASHNMFLDGHFGRAFNEYQIDAVQVDQAGNEKVIGADILGSYIYGRFWVHWMFTVGARNPSDAFFRERVDRYILHWVRVNGFVGDDVQFRLRERSYQVLEFAWKKDAYKINAAAPWDEAAQISYAGNVLTWTTN